MVGLLSALRNRLPRFIGATHMSDFGSADFQFISACVLSLTCSFHLFKLCFSIWLAYSGLLKVLKPIIPIIIGI